MHPAKAIPAAALALAAILPVSQGFLLGQDRSHGAPGSIPSNDAAIERAHDSWQQGRYQEAEELYRQIYISDPQDLRGLAGLTEMYVSEGRPDDAVKLMQEESAKYPDRTDLRTALANLYVRTGQYDLAIAELKGVLDSGKPLPPEERATLLFRLGDTYRENGDLDEAMTWFRASAEANPKDTKALMQLALVLDGSRRPDQAAPIYEMILKAQPDQPVALNNLAYIVAQKGADPDRALALAQKAARTLKDSPEVQDTLGWAYLKKNQPDQAVAAFRAALQVQPGNPTFHYHLGLALLPIGERDAAIEEFQTALANRPPAQDEEQIRELLNKIAP